jgi:hypothetical protein
MKKLVSSLVVIFILIMILLLRSKTAFPIMR